jgi:hypothetical protein
MSHVVLAAANNFNQQHVGCIHSGIAASLQISACKQEANGSMEAGKQQRGASQTPQGRKHSATSPMSDMACK